MSPSAEGYCEPPSDEERSMRVQAAIILGACLPMAALSQQQSIPLCNAIRLLEREREAHEADIAYLKSRFPDKQVAIASTQTNLDAIMRSLTTAKAKAASQGLDCTTSDTPPPRQADTSR